jgi:hypothetical protein
MSPIAAVHSVTPPERSTDSLGRREERTRILAAATRLFARTGDSGAGISEFARATGEPAVAFAEEAARTALDIFLSGVSPAGTLAGRPIGGRTLGEGAG